MRKIFFFLLFFSIPLITLATPVFAVESLTGNACIHSGTVTFDCIPILFGNLVYWLLIFSGVVALFFILLGGIKFLTSAGDQNKLDGAKKTITFSIIGLTIVILSFMTVNVVADMTGVSCITRFARLGFSACGIDSSTYVSCQVEGCPRGKACRQVSFGYYGCVTLCSGGTRGWCPSGKSCVYTSTVPPSYTCR